MLSDVEIWEAMETGDIKLDPPPKRSARQPASIDVHLGNRFGALIHPGHPVRLTDPSTVDYVMADEVVLRPRAFVLAQLQERLTLSARMVARIEGKSSNGRKGLAIHVTAGFVDPGWDGILTIELFNTSSIVYILKAGDPIGQLAFSRLEVAAARPYGHEELGSHFQGSDEVRGS